MDNSQIQFKQDTLELIEKLEQTLLSLEQSPEQTELVEEAFRSLHTIKGAAYMFGFQSVGHFAHELENLFVIFRDGKLRLNSNVTGFTFEALDHIRLLLDSPEDMQLLQVSETLTQKTKLVQFSSTKTITEKSNLLYLLDIQLNEVLDLESGLPITFLFDDLHDLGEYKEWKDNEIGGFQHTQLLVITQQSKEDIEALFIFYEDELQVKIVPIADKNLTKEQLQRFDLTAPWDTEMVKTWWEHQLQQNAIQELLFTQNTENAKNSQETRSIRISEERVNELMESVSELVTLQARFKDVMSSFENIELQNAYNQLEQVVNRIREGVFSISLTPISTQKTRFQRLIRDLSKQLGKQVRFETRGEETELDKLVVEALTEPLLHIFRNALDHGIETPQEREKQGKSPEGRILLHAYYSGANVYLEISDDGKGINPAKIGQIAIQRGLLPEDHQKTDEELLQFIFHAGFSTAQSVTDVSGRGVGMDVVKRQIQALRGKVEIESLPKKGTTIRIRLPLTMSIIDGLLVQCQGTFLVLPLNMVENIMAVKSEDLTQLTNQFSGLLSLEDRQLSLINLNKLFQTQEQAATSKQKMIIFILDAHQKERGLVVDAVKGEVQAVLKPLGVWYKQQDFLSGTTILGNGQLALVLDVEKLLDKAEQFNLT